MQEVTGKSGPGRNAGGKSRESHNGYRANNFVREVKYWAHAHPLA